MSDPTVAALFVMPDGPYYANIGTIEPWGLPDRDARDYRGPHPVIAHPPCKRWGRYWSGGPSARVRRELGDDDGCFAYALYAVRRWGGIVEHPEASHAWAVHGIARPPKGGGWIEADRLGGRTSCVEQGHYGHRARKATWLYAYRVATPELTWGKAPGRARLDDGCHSAAERASGQGAGRTRITARECAETPPEFARLLIGMVRGRV